jgi:D-aminopeptidase
VAEGDTDGGQRPIDLLFQATIEATEDAILNALFKAETVTGRDGNISEALPLNQVRELFRAAGRDWIDP